MTPRIRHKKAPHAHLHATKKGLARAACSSLDRHDFDEQVTPRPQFAQGLN